MTTCDKRRARISFRSWHRGTREMDLIVGRFADAVLPDLPEHELTAFEAMLEMQDPDVYDWVTGQKPAPNDVTNPVLLRLIQSLRG
jgi:antitoxin CptB